MCSGADAAFVDGVSLHLHLGSCIIVVRSRVDFQHLDLSAFLLPLLPGVADAAIVFRGALP